jgi:hypothetical protein
MGLTCFAALKANEGFQISKEQSMYRHHIQGMTKEVVAAIGMSKDCKKIEKVERVLEGYWANRIAIVWGVEDIVDRAKDLGKRISKSKALEILNKVHHNHDATLGINWDVIDTYL